MTADLDKIEAAAKGATPGPWQWTAEDSSMCILHGLDHLADAVVTAVVCKNCEKHFAGEPWEFGRCYSPSSADAAYLASIDPSTILALIAETRRLREDVARLCGVVRPMLGTVKRANLLDLDDDDFRGVRLGILRTVARLLSDIQSRDNGERSE